MPSMLTRDMSRMLSGGKSSRQMEKRPSQLPSERTLRNTRGQTQQPHVALEPGSLTIQQVQADELVDIVREGSNSNGLPVGAAAML